MPNALVLPDAVIGVEEAAVRAMQVMVTVQDLLDHFDRQAQQEVQKMKTIIFGLI